MLNFVKGFLCLYWDNSVIFIFPFVNVVYHIDWFVDSEESVHPWDKAHLVMVYDRFNMLTLYLKQLEKEEMKNPKVSRRKEIIKIKAEINEKERRL